MARGKKLAAVDQGPVEGPWELPDGWHWERLASVTEEFFSGRRPKGGVSGISEGPLSLGGEHLHWNGTLKLLNPKRIPAAFAETIGGCMVSEGDILIVKDGATTGKCALVPKLTDQAYINEHLFAVRPTNAINRKLLFYWLWSTYGFDMIMQDFRGAAQGGIGRTFVEKVLVPVPPVNLQADIAAKIDTLFYEIDAGEAELAEARAGVEVYRKSLLKAAVTGELTADWRRNNPPQQSGEAFLARILTDRRERWEADAKNARKKYVEPSRADIDDLPELPEGWCWASLQQIAFISGGATVDKKRKPDNPIEVPYLRVANVQRGALDLSKMKTINIDQAKLADLRLMPGDILLNEGGDRDKVGRGWIWEGQLEICAHQNHVFKARPASEVLQPKLISMYLNELGRRFFLDESKQTTNLASISLTKVARAPVAIPPANEALAILAAIDANIDTAIEAPEIKRAELAAATLRQSILAAAFRGDLTA